MGSCIFLIEGYNSGVSSWVLGELRRSEISGPMAVTGKVVYHGGREPELREENLSGKTFVIHVPFPLDPAYKLVEYYSQRGGYIIAVVPWFNGYGELIVSDLYRLYGVGAVVWKNDSDGFYCEVTKAISYHLLKQWEVPVEEAREAVLIG